MAHDPSCPFHKEIEINQRICLGPGLSVEAKEKARCVILFSFRFTIFREEVAVWLVEECDGPLETSMWASLCHCLMNLRFIPRVTFHQPSLINAN